MSTPEPTEEPEPERTPEIPPDVICLTKEELAELRDRMDRLSKRMSSLSAKTKKYLDSMGKNEDEREARALSEALLQKLEHISKLGQDQIFSYPFLLETQSIFKLVSVVPMIGEQREPGKLSRVVQPIFKRLVEITDWDGIYEGVSANISYVSSHPESIRYLVVHNHRRASCSIKSFSLLFYDKQNKVFKYGTGKLHLSNDTNEDQIFELPSYVDTRAVRIVVHENWGNTTNTCFDGMRVYQV